MSQSPLDRLKARFAAQVIQVDTDAIDPFIEVSRDGLVAVCEFLRDDAEFRLDMLNCITAVDWFQPDPKKAKKAGFDPHLELVYHLSSIEKKHTLVLKVKLPRWKDDQEGHLPDLDSVAGVWRGADWHEREVFDLSGVNFVGHPDLRRILCPEDWEGYPLRKDYEMPLEYHGIRGR